MTTDERLLAFLETALTLGADKAYLTEEEFGLVERSGMFKAYFAYNTMDTYDLTGGCYGRYKGLKIYNDEGAK